MTPDQLTFASYLQGARRVLVTTHVRPDGDALGTAAAMVLGLRQKNVEAHVLLLSKLPSKYAFVFNDAPVEFTSSSENWPEGLKLDDFDALLVVDTGTWSQLPGLKEVVEPWGRPKLILDHHLTQENWATIKLVDTTAAAAAELAGEFLSAWGVQMTTAIASALYVGLVSDTGWFQFSNTTPRTLRMGASLLEAGVDADRINRLLNQSERAERILLQARALESLQLLHDRRIAVMTIRQADFAATGAAVPDTENLINVPLAIATVEASILITEPTEGPMRVSLRSKGGLDCASLAEQFGGGGHARAAGLKIAGPVDRAGKQIVEAVLARLGR